MYVCICMYVYVCMYICVCVCVCIFRCMCRCMCMYVCMCIYVCMHRYIYLYFCRAIDHILFTLIPGNFLVFTWKIKMLSFRQFSLSYPLLCDMCIYIVCVRVFVLACRGAGSSPGIIISYSRRHSFV